MSSRRGPDGSPIEPGAPPVRLPGAAGSSAQAAAAAGTVEEDEAGATRAAPDAHHPASSEAEQTVLLSEDRNSTQESLQSEPTAPLEPVDPTQPKRPITNVAAAARRTSSPHFHAAICQRCGGGKRGPFVPCKSCGFTPTGAERHVAWLFSEHHLDVAELMEAARRIREGERPDPPRSLLEQARVEMGAAPLSDSARTPLRGKQVVLLTAANLLLTPLAGMAVWWGLRTDRPVAARQALRLTVPVGIGLAFAWAGLLLNWTVARF